MLAHDDETNVAAGAALQAIAAVSMGRLSYEAYFRKINELIGQVGDHWKQEQRVKALKVVIQLAKLLADSSQARLYAKKHRLITESLDEFGRLVYERVHSIARRQPGGGGPRDQSSSGQRSGSKDSDAQDEASHYQLELAKDISRNWFLKVASIRELVPRFYIELAILGAYDILFASASMVTVPSPAARLLEEQFFLQALGRLTKIARGFGNPIVALHARVYLCQVADRLLADWVRRGIVPLDRPTQQQLPAGEVILANLNCCATLVRRLDVELLVDNTDTEATPTSTVGRASSRTSDNLGFELVSNPIATILNLLVSKHEDAIQDRELGRATQINQELQLCFDELFNNLAQGERADCALRRNAILNAICKTLPGELASSRGGRLMYELRVGYDKWKHELRLLEGQLNNTAAPMECEDLAGLDTNSRPAKLRQSTILSFYTSLTNLMIALDGCEQIVQQQQQQRQQADHDDQLDPGQLLAGAELMLDELASLQPGDGLASTDHLRCFKACLTYANHYVSEAAVDRLLRNYLAQFGARRRTSLHTQEQAINLLDIIKTLFTSRTSLAEFERLLTLSSFNKLFECLRKDDHRLDAAKWILESMRANVKLNHERGPAGCHSNIITKRAMISFLLKLFGTINETVSPLAVRDELEELARLVIFYLDLILLDDVHERLEFYLRCRSCVGNLHLALEYLIRQVYELPDTHKLVERKRGARQNFHNGCLAFAFTTIPALQDNPCLQLELYQYGCRLALERSSLSLVDYYLKQIIATLANLLDDDRSTSGVSAHPDHQAGPSRGGDKGSRASGSMQLREQVKQLLELVLEHEDQIDLKHKMTISELVGESFADFATLLQSLKHLNCIDRQDNDDNSNDNNDS